MSVDSQHVASFTSAVFEVRPRRGVSVLRSFLWLRDDPVCCLSLFTILSWALGRVRSLAVTGML